MLLSSFVLYLPLYFKDFSVIYRHYDGPFYMYIAKTFYIIPPDHPFHQNIPATYYASFFPLYPILIRVMTLFTIGNYPLAMIFTTLSCSVAAGILFYILLKEWQVVKWPLWTSVLFCFFPERWLFQHSIGSTEPLFFCLIFSALIAYKKRKDWNVFLAVSLACITRPPGFLLVPIFILIYLRARNFRMAMLMPLALWSLGGLFYYHHIVFGDLLASYHIHTSMAFVSSTTKQSSLSFAPLSIYRFYAEHPSFHSTQLFLLLYVVNLIGTLALWKRKELFIYSAVSFVFVLFIFSYELPRYLLPIAPFALLIGFDEILTRRSVCFIVFPFFLYLAYTFIWGFLPLATCSKSAFEIMLQQIQRL
jgi:Gpi18-like mannosyltransferase